MQPSSDRPAMRRKATFRSEFGHDLVQRQAALDRDPLPQPVGMGGQLLEGPEAAVEATFARIDADDRHIEVCRLPVMDPKP